MPRQYKQNHFVLGKIVLYIVRVQNVPPIFFIEILIFM